MEYRDEFSLIEEQVSSIGVFDYGTVAAHNLRAIKNRLSTVGLLTVARGLMSREVYDLHI